MTISNKYFELLKAKKIIYIKADKENIRFLNELKKECLKKDMCLNIELKEGFYHIRLSNTKKRYIVQCNDWSDSRGWVWINKKYFNCKNNAEQYKNKENTRVYDRILKEYL